MHVCEIQGGACLPPNPMPQSHSSISRRCRWDYQASAANGGVIIKIRLVTPHQLDLRVKRRWGGGFNLLLLTHGWKYQTCERLSLSRVRNPGSHLNLLIASL